MSEQSPKKSKAELLEEAKKALDQLEENKKESDAALKKALDEKIASLSSSTPETTSKVDSGTEETVRPIDLEGGEEVSESVTLEPNDKESKELTPEEKVGETRGKYIDEFVKYRKETRAWQGFSKKTLENTVRNLGRHFISKSTEEKYVKDKYPNLETLKADYDRARVELGNKMYAEKKAELEKTVTNPDDLKSQLDEYKKDEIFTKIHLEEQVKLNAQRAEKLPPIRRELLNKALGKGADVISAVMKGYKATGDWGKEFKILGHKMRAGQLVRSSVFALGTGLSFGAAAYTIKLVRSTAITIGGGIWMAKLNSKHQENIARLNEDKAKLEMSVSATGEVDLIEYEKQLAQIDSEIKKENRKHGLKSAGVMALMLGTNYGSGKIEHSMFGNGPQYPGDHSHEHNNSINKPKVPETPTPKTPEPVVPKPPEPAPATGGIPKEAMIDAEHNVGITYALKSQLEANSDLAQKLGYDVAPNKAQFLADLGKKLGYINEHGDVRVQANMGAAYVLNPDGSVTEYQNGVQVEAHHVGDKFEDAGQQESYERYHENKVSNPTGGKGEFDGPAISIAPGGARVEGSPDEFAGEATGIGNNNGLYGGEHRDMRGGNDRNTMNDGFKPLSTNGAAEEMARRAGGTNNIESAANSSNVNIESTEQFINTKTNILDKDFSRWFTRGSVSKEWAHIRNSSMDELTKPTHEFASRGEAKGVARLLTEAKNAGVDYRGKTADQLVNEIVKKELAK